jgi:hypothetical protein
MRLLLCLAVAFSLTSCAFQGTIVEKQSRPHPLYHSVGIEGVYTFVLRDNAGAVNRQMVTPEVFDQYAVGDYFNDLQAPTNREEAKNTRTATPTEPGVTLPPYFSSHQPTFDARRTTIVAKVAPPSPLPASKPPVQTAQKKPAGATATKAVAARKSTSVTQTKAVAQSSKSGVVKTKAVAAATGGTAKKNAVAHTSKSATVTKKAVAGSASSGAAKKKAVAQSSNNASAKKKVAARNSHSSSAKKKAIAQSSKSGTAKKKIASASSKSSKKRTAAKSKTRKPFKVTAPTSDPNAPSVDVSTANGAGPTPIPVGDTQAQPAPTPH